ncbi:MAG: GDSL-type esterase/lipase family protein [Saprospiraceae bacterium]
MKQFTFIFLLLIGTYACKTSQTDNLPDPSRFASEIAQFENIAPVAAKEVVVFTGSSSVRMWKNVQDFYPQYLVINTGFGGSQMSDLLHYLEETVLRFQPSKVFIYEGDNDVNAGQSLKTIMQQTHKVVKEIEKKLPQAEIIIIGAKPSPARWHLKAEYLDLNNSLKVFADSKANRFYADVWTIMLDDNGMVREDIFIEDRLHMNDKGYQLWDQVMRLFLD